MRTIFNLPGQNTLSILGITSFFISVQMDIEESGGGEKLKNVYAFMLNNFLTKVNFFLLYNLRVCSGCSYCIPVPKTMICNLVNIIF